MLNLLMVLALLMISGASALKAEMIKIEGGSYEPFYPPSPQEKKIKVSSFMLDAYPITNQDFLSFVQNNPKWRRDKISKLYADRNYLKHWASPISLGTLAKPKQPVTNVSWFAAKAYCEAKNLRLPKEYEWEYVAMASDTETNGKSNLPWRQKVLTWYSKPKEILGEVGSGLPSYWKVHDLHGLIWEWVDDFNSNYITVDSREGSSGDKMKFCGAGAFFANEKDDYPSFMRNAMRSSLKAYYTTTQLGFRCAKDVQ